MRNWDLKIRRGEGMESSGRRRLGGGGSKEVVEGLGFGGLDGGMVSGFYIWNKIKNKKKIENTLK